MVWTDFVSLTYTEPLAPRHCSASSSSCCEGQIIGHKCPSCGRVYVPGKGYCPRASSRPPTSDEVEVQDTGTVTGYTIITPVQYYGQQETEPFVVASVLLDGADTPLGGQDIVNIPHDEVRSGLRVKAIWKPEGERSVRRHEQPRLGRRRRRHRGLRTERRARRRRSRQIKEHMF